MSSGLALRAMSDVRRVFLVLGSALGFAVEVITPDVGPRQVLAELLSVEVRAIWYMFVPGGLDLR